MTRRPLRNRVPFTPRTQVSLIGKQWLVNEKLTYRGTRAEGLLMNVRMVNSVFEDRRKPDFDPDANTDRFLAQLPDYAAHGVGAVTLCLQGRHARLRRCGQLGVCCPMGRCDRRI